MQQSSAAYDLSIFEARPERQRPELRVERSEKARPGLLGKIDFRWLQAVAVASVLVALVCSVLFSQTRTTELSANIVSQQNALVSLQSEYTYLANEMEMRTNLKTVESYATSVLGLVPLEKSQITYITEQAEVRVERHETGLAQIADEISRGLLSIAQSISG
jgi:hypothetical protein